jgi:ELWxxDGT repeat protein
VFLTRFEDRVLFRADDGAHGTELWTSDGTAAGTMMLLDINQRGSSSPMPPTIAGHRVFFSADDGVRGAEPWLSDGTAAGTHFLFDINPTGPSNPLNFTALGDRVVFAADDGQHGNELWVSDGTPAGTQLVRDINPGAASSSPLDFAVIGDRAYFVVVVDADQTTGTVRTQLWTTDGTSAGTTLVWEAPGRFPGYVVRHLTALGSQLLFHAPSAVDDNGLSTDIELYRLAAVN